MIEIVLPLLFGSAPEAGDWSYLLQPTVNLAQTPVLPGRAWNRGVAEVYGVDWNARRIDPEIAHQWDTLPSLGSLGFGARRDSFTIHCVLPLRRDLEAWARDPIGGNVLEGVDELDMNVPYEGWIRLGGTHFGSFQLGRFRRSFSESPHGVILGSNIVHDAAWWSLPMGHWRFDWFASSLNPWLKGIAQDLPTDTGSEAGHQASRTITNQRGRIYQDPYKTLFVHRLQYANRGWTLGIVEQLIVGGKAPSLRDALPVQVWHDDYGDGFSKVSTSLDISWQNAALGEFHAQGLFEDVAVPVGEVVGVDPRVIFGTNTGWAGGGAAGPGSWFARLDFTATSPTLNNHRVPLLRGVSRRLYRSNNEVQGTPGFADTWIVDQPLAYHRGADAADLWSRVDWTDSAGIVGFGAELDFLQQGDASQVEDDALLDHRAWPLSGIVERELRTGVSGTHRFGNIELGLGVGASRFWNRDFQGGLDDWQFTGWSRLSWRIDGLIHGGTNPKIH